MPRRMRSKRGKAIASDLTNVEIICFSYSSAHASGSSRSDVSIVWMFSLGIGTLENRCSSFALKFDSGSSSGTMRSSAKKTSLSVPLSVTQTDLKRRQGHQPFIPVDVGTTNEVLSQDFRQAATAYRDLERLLLRESRLLGREHKRREPLRQLVWRGKAVQNRQVRMFRRYALNLSHSVESVDGSSSNVIVLRCLCNTVASELIISSE